MLRKEQGRLKVMGMYHCNGPVTSMRALRHPKMLSVVYIVAGEDTEEVEGLHSGPGEEFQLDFNTGPGPHPNYNVKRRSL